MTKNKKRNTYMYILLAVGIIILVAGSAIMAKKYAPTKERMDLSEVYGITFENEAAVIIDGTYTAHQEGDDYANAVILSGMPYMQIDFLKANIDNGYVYDRDEGILRYTTDKDIISANRGDSSYFIGRSEENVGVSIIEEEGGEIYLALPFIKEFSDITYTVESEPDRIVIEKAGWEKTVATVKRNTQIRRLGGPKSKILADVKKGDGITVIENVGKWSCVMTGDGVIGYMPDKYIVDRENDTTPATLPERDYRHISMSDKVSLGWFQTMEQSGNAGLDGVLSDAGDSINVISPTWFRLSDNKGGISNIASYDSVKKCHDKGIQVWALLNNFDNKDVDSSVVLGSTSARDNLINNLIGAAVAYDLDGINVDFEYLQESDADGFLEFVRELSIKCENNDIVLSIDNYVPSSFHAFYDYAEQAKYADYIVIMAYDEHYAGGDEAGSVSSIGFVSDAAKNMLEYVPKEQIVMGLPFYYRLWVTNSTGLSSSAIHMDETEELLEKYDVTTTWLDDVGQSYAEFDRDDSFYQMWIEDPKSLGLKLSVVKENDLAGAAFWKLGLETAAAWDVINEYLQ